VLVLPVAAELSTASVYAEADRLGRPRTRVDLRELARALREVFADGAQLPPESLLVNDLQRAAVSLCPQIQDALAQALACGADVALVSGSGPTVLGLFAGADGPTRAGCAVEKLVGCAPAPWSAGSAYAPGGHLLAPVAAVPVDVGSGHVHVVSVP
jgi:4-diphosphocytidyl-2-C-methyl-D-erythritol kinase